MSAGYDILDVIFCDDIRQEVNGKMMLIGVYPQNVATKSVPATFGLSIWIRLRHLAQGKHTFKAIIQDPDGDTAEATGEILVSRESIPSVIALPAVRKRVQHWGDFILKLAIDDEDPKEVARLPYEQTAPAPPKASTPV